MSWRRGTKINLRRWAQVRLQVFDRDGWRCQACGRAGRLEAHHVQPLEAGGAPYDLPNLETLCRGCHCELHRAARNPERAAWRVFLRGL